MNHQNPIVVIGILAIVSLIGIVPSRSRADDLFSDFDQCAGREHAVLPASSIESLLDCGYLQIHSGLARLKDIEIPVTGVPGAGGPIDLRASSNDGFAFGGSLGLWITQNLRAEYELTWRNNTWNQFQFGVPSLGIPNTSTPLGGEINSISNMWNAILELPTGDIRPYFGGGIGVSFFDTDIANALAGGEFAAVFPGFTYQGMAGLVVRVTDHADLFGEYRYFAMSEVSASIAAPGANISASGNYETNNIFAGVRLHR